ncbi:hypothetical protein GOV07_02495 [Candidatus Woesearchaeota archaeon]|nr:hypothetical protein [Candidatus Woesearchaeota archaeon]
MKAVIVALIFLLCVGLVVANPLAPAPIKDTLEQGQSKVYQYEGEEYEVKLLAVTDAKMGAGGSMTLRFDDHKARFSLNGEFTSDMSPGTGMKLKCGTIEVVELRNRNAVDDPIPQTATFTLKPLPCGLRPIKAAESLVPEETAEPMLVSDEPTATTYGGGELTIEVNDPPKGLWTRFSDWFAGLFKKS